MKIAVSHNTNPSHYGQYDTYVMKLSPSCVRKEMEEAK
jgi:hypothetical protein